ncbi:hypothetical protein [Algoriphagus sp.]|uniref:hypothetical protein n=1 Tax=Algoriphagus sp. TaxID=1872435 RepID=UPI0032989844
MKINSERTVSIFEGGKEGWESSGEFRKKIHQLKRQIQDKYKPELSLEKNWFKRLILKTRIWLEIKRNISAMKSGRNLHISI